MPHFQRGKTRLQPTKWPGTAAPGRRSRRQGRRELRSILRGLVALNNVAKHAHAGHASLRLRRYGGSVELRIDDDGRSCDPAQALGAGGSGLGGMRERMRLYGGRLELQSAAGEGMRLIATIPFELTPICPSLFAGEGPLRTAKQGERSLRNGQTPLSRHFAPPSPPRGEGEQGA